MTRKIDGYTLHFDDRGRIQFDDSRMLLELGMKYCPRCKSVKSVSQFYKVKRRRDGLCHQCKECSAAEARFYARNSYSVRANNLNQNAKRRYGQDGTVTGNELKALLEAFSFCCAYCGKDIADDYQIDHIIPASQGGSNTIHNMLPSCAKCNQHKNDQTLAQWLSPMFAFYAALGR